MSGDYLEKYVMRPPIAGGACTCGATGDHLLFEHDAQISERAEQAAGVQGADDVLVVNVGPANYLQSGDVKARILEIVPALAGRVVVVGVQDVAVVRAPSTSEQSRRWRAEMAGYQFAQDMVPQPEPTTYVRVADLAAELGTTEDDVISAGTQPGTPGAFMVGMAPSGRIITSHDAERIRALIRREQDERDEGAAQRVEALDLEDEHGRAMDNR